MTHDCQDKKTCLPVTTLSACRYMVSVVTPGELLKAWRARVGLTQEELASAGEVTRSYVNDCEADRASPTVRTLLRLIAAIERSYGPLGKTEHRRLARFFLGPSVEGTLIVAKETIPLEGRRR